MMRFITLLILIPVIVLVAVFSFRNAQMVKIDLLLTVINLPLAAVILVSLVLGVALGFAVNAWVLIKQRNRTRILKRRIHTMSGLADILKTSDK